MTTTTTTTTTTTMTTTTTTTTTTTMTTTTTTTTMTTTTTKRLKVTDGQKLMKRLRNCKGIVILYRPAKIAQLNRNWVFPTKLTTFYGASATALQYPGCSQT